MSSGKRRARIRVPASTSNLGSAFDSVGLALQLYLTLEVKELERGPSCLERSGVDAHQIPIDESNLIWQTMVEVAAEGGVELPPFSLVIENQIPVTRGLGSSASACLAGAAATSFLCDLDLGVERLLEIAATREGHPDNAAPELLGGLVASVSAEKIQCARSEFPSDWTVVTVTPDLRLPTKQARDVLPDTVRHSDAVYNVQRSAFLMAQLAHGRREGVREAMSDRLHQPYRSSLIPGLKEILNLKDEEGLIGIALSGAGPTVIALADAQEAEIGGRISEVFLRHDLASETRLLKADNHGLTLRIMD